MNFGWKPLHPFNEKLKETKESFLNAECVRDYSQFSSETLQNLFFYFEGNDFVENCATLDQIDNLSLKLFFRGILLPEMIDLLSLQDLRKIAMFWGMSHPGTSRDQLHRFIIKAEKTLLQTIDLREKNGYGKICDLLPEVESFEWQKLEIIHRTNSSPF